MHYFAIGVNIAAVETAEQAAKYAAAGWRPVSREVFMAVWQARDAMVLAGMAEPSRVVTAPIERLPRGWARYSV